MEHQPEGLPAGEVARLLEVPQNTMSSHLAILARAGLVESERRGRTIFYRPVIDRVREIDWIPLPGTPIRPTQGRTLALMQVSGGSQSFNAVNQMRILGRWMRMVTIPNQSSVAKAWQEFDETGRMKPSSYYDRIVDVMEELVKFTLVNRRALPDLAV